MAAGTLSSAVSNGATVSFEDGAFEAIGTPAEVNAVLAELQFTPSAGYRQDVSLSTTVSDGKIGGTVSGSTIALRAADVIPVNISLETTDAEATEEGNAGQFLISLDAPSEIDLEIAYDLSGSAINGSDYEALSGTVIVPAGETVARIGIVPHFDTLSEAGETATLTLADGYGYAIAGNSNGTVTLADATSQQSYGPFVYVNPANGHQYLFTREDSWLGAQEQAEALGGNLVTINDAAENQWLVDIFVQTNKSWIGLNDSSVYGNQEGQFRWVSGEPATYRNWADVEPNNFVHTSSVVDPGEHFGELYFNSEWNDALGSYNITNLVSGIIEVDPATLANPLVWVTATDSKIGESGNAGQLVFQRVSDLSTDLTVNYAISGSATNGEDFQALDGAVVIPAGETFVTLPVLPIFDGQLEAQESLTVTLQNGDYDLGTKTEVALTVEDSNAPFVPEIITNPATGKRYFLTAHDDWLGAQEQATSLGGNLVTVDDASEQAWLENAFASLHWIGLTDSPLYGATEGNHRWVTGAAIGETFWDGDEPNNSSNDTADGRQEGEDFGEWRSGIWNDHPATYPTHNYRGIVELPDSSATIYTPNTSYLSIDDSPFPDLDLSSFYLEDFEDGALDALGLSISGGILRPAGNTTDSVDGDDGVIGSSGRNGHSWHSNGADRLTLSFDAAALGGRLPTHVGFAFTDIGQPDEVSVIAYDGSGAIVGNIEPTLFGDIYNTGETAEDRFFGISHEDGISRFTISTPQTGWEIDHIQYGMRDRTLIPWEEADGGNGNTYEVVARPNGITWAEAKLEAEQAGGHLVTLTSAAENEFVHSLISHRPDVWLENNLHGPWIGAFQPPEAPEPDGGYQWVTGEPFEFTNWLPPGEPNNFFGDNEDFVHFLSGDPNVSTPTWNDGLDTERLYGYIIEYETYPSDNDLFVGTPESDRLSGNGGNDTLRGLGGNDDLVSGPDVDFIDGGDGIDRVFFHRSGSPVNVNLEEERATFVDGEGQTQTETILNVERAIGSAFDDTLVGDAVSNVLEGNDGNDSLVGGDGNDDLIGGPGTDTIDGGSGVDRVFFDDIFRSGDEYAVNANLAEGKATFIDGGGQTQTETIRNVESAIGGLLDDTLVGDAGANTLEGNDGDDSLIGGAGDDILSGGSGNNTLRGDSGSDRFDLALDGFAAIADFQPGTDFLGLPAGVTFTDLTIAPDIDPTHTLIWNGTNPIARLENISSTTIGAANFQNI